MGKINKKVFKSLEEITDFVDEARPDGKFKLIQPMKSGITVIMTFMGSFT